MKQFLVISFLVCFSFSASAQDIKLPQPSKKGGMPLMEALSLRQSSRNFTSEKLDSQTLSNLLWAAYGFNREDKRTVPSSQNRQEIDLYVMMSSGIYFYDAKSNTLVLKAGGDYKKGLGGQAFAHSAALNIICVANVDKASSREACYIDSGFILQNIHLFCASEGLGAVIRGSFDKDLLAEYLKLTDKQEVTITQTVGHIE